MQRRICNVLSVLCVWWLTCICGKTEKGGAPRTVKFQDVFPPRCVLMYEAAEPRCFSSLVQVIMQSGAAFDPALKDTICASLLKVGLFEKAGDLYCHLRRDAEALEAYRR